MLQTFLHHCGIPMAIGDLPEILERMLCLQQGHVDPALLQVTHNAATTSCGPDSHVLTLEGAGGLAAAGVGEDATGALLVTCAPGYMSRSSSAAQCAVILQWWQFSVVSAMPWIQLTPAGSQDKFPSAGQARIPMVHRCMSAGRARTDCERIVQPALVVVAKIGVSQLVVGFRLLICLQEAGGPASYPR